MNILIGVLGGGVALIFLAWVWTAIGASGAGVLAVLLPLLGLSAGAALLVWVWGTVTGFGRWARRQ